MVCAPHGPKCDLAFGNEAMKRRPLLLTAAAVALLVCPHVLSLAEEKASEGPLQVSKKDICPVCGMFVHKYPNWLAHIIFKDRTYAFFDGAKDMAKYYLELKKYNPHKTIDDILAIWITDYYTIKLIDGRKAFYVVGSDVLGPMGRELIPHVSEKAAGSFVKDHGGEKTLRFHEIDLNLIERLR